MIKEEHKRLGSGGLYTVECDDRDALEAYLVAKVNTIDPYRSPSNQGIRPLMNGNFIGTVKYYGLD